MGTQPVCSPDGGVCLQALQTSSNTIVMTLVSSTAGWAGFGVGAAMANAAIYVGWRDSAGIVTSNRLGSGHSLPAVGNQLQALAAEPRAQPPTAAGIAFSVELKRDLIVGSRSFLWARSSIKPATPSSPSSTFTQHSDFGVFSIDLNAKSAVALPKGFSYNTIVILHGALMFVAWNVAPLLGIAASRYLKDYFDGKELIVHGVVIGVFGVLGAIASFILILLYKPAPLLSISAHSILGLILLGLLLVEAGLGFVCHWHYNEYRPSHRWYNRTHAILGASIVVVASVNILLGLILFEQLGFTSTVYVPVIYAGIAALAAVAFILLEWRHTRAWRAKRRQFV
ncbi:hypothetical protein HK105_206966 [Polyrhizophydium stewartii]|uniref:Cytochrome b561 domain-containing protein n=1 Tax=Polyrhizophydium stewartii TaxID=2732419 RepID=A0ABR4N1V3_9FUNG